MFIIWTSTSAVARHIQTIIVTRFFNNSAEDTFVSVEGGRVGDVFPHNEIQNANGP
jgi:hypothetical protein